MSSSPATCPPVVTDPGQLVSTRGMQDVPLAAVAQPVLGGHGHALPGPPILTAG